MSARRVALLVMSGTLLGWAVVAVGLLVCAEWSDSPWF